MMILIIRRHIGLIIISNGLIALLVEHLLEKIELTSRHDYNS